MSAWSISRHLGASLLLLLAISALAYSINPRLRATTQANPEFTVREWHLARMLATVHTPPPRATHKHPPPPRSKAKSPPPKTVQKSKVNSPPQKFKAPPPPTRFKQGIATAPSRKPPPPSRRRPPLSRRPPPISKRPPPVLRRPPPILKRPPPVLKRPPPVSKHPPPPLKVQQRHPPPLKQLSPPHSPPNNPTKSPPPSSPSLPPSNSPPLPISPPPVNSVPSGPSVAVCKDKTFYCPYFKEQGTCDSTQPYMYEGQSIYYYWCPIICGACRPAPSPPPRPPSPPNSPPPPVSDYQVRMLELVNQGRAANGKDPVCLNQKLIEVAYNHCYDMYKNNYLSQIGLDGSDISDRVERAGYKDWVTLGENLAAGYPTVDTLYAGWKANAINWGTILGEFVHMGVSKFGNRWTQVFANSTIETCVS